MPRSRTTYQTGRKSSAGGKKTSPEAPASPRTDVRHGAALTYGETELYLSNLDKVLYPSVGFTKGRVIDHDPGQGADIIDCIKVALHFRAMLRDLKLECFAKTSGGRGLHVYVPLITPVTFGQTKDLPRAMAGLMARDDPKHVTANMRKDLRAGKVFVDWSQNDNHKTTVSAYSLRAREYPTVSTPVSWEELEEAKKRKDASRLVFRSEQALERIETRGDLFTPVLELKQKLPAMSL